MVEPAKAQAIRGRPTNQRAVEVVKILSLIETLTHGGAETVATHLALGLRDHDLRFFHYSGANGSAVHQPFIQHLETAQIPVFDVHWSSLQSPAGRARLLGEWRPDLVLFHWWKNHPLSSWMEQARTMDGNHGPTFVCVLHHQGDPGVPLYDHYVAVTPSQLTDLDGAKKERVTLIPNGIDLSPYAEMASCSASERFVIGRISSLRAGKIPEDWIRTASGFNIPDAQWVIAGDDSLRAALEQDAQTLGVTGIFTFPGYISTAQRPQRLAGFDVCCYVTGAMAEAHPLTLMETAAAGVPIVAESRGGIPDIVKHGVNGLLGSSTSEIGAHLQRLRADPGLRSALAAGARDVAAGFSLNLQLARYEALLAELVPSAYHQARTARSPPPCPSSAEKPASTSSSAR